MHTIIRSLIIALVLLILTFAAFFIIRYQRKKWNRAIPIAGVFISGVIAYFPLNTDYNLFSNVAASLLDSAKLFFLESNYYETIAEVFFRLGYESVLGEVVFVLLFIIAPICTAAIIISLISDAITYLGLKIPTIESKYIFSELNEKTLALAKSMKEEGMNGLYIFCDVSRHGRDQNPYYEMAKYYEKEKRTKFQIIEKLAISISPSKKRDTYYFAMSENASENLDLTLRLMEIYKDYEHVKIYITSNEAEDEALLDNKIEELNKIIDSGGVKFYLRHIKETQLMAYELLYKMPLYKAVSENEKKVSMLIIGGGYAGLEVLKNSIWCSRSLNFEFDATVLDKDIARAEGIFSRFAPALKKEEYNLTFVPTNIDAATNAPLDFVESNEGKFNYIVISTDNDEINIKTALDLRSWYLRKCHSAIISVSVRDSQKYDLLENLADKSKKPTDESKKTDVVLYPCGCSSKMYKYDKIIDSKLEKYAICINAVYDRSYNLYDSNTKSDERKSEVTYESAIESWRKLKLLKKRSSMALGVYIRYLLWMMGYKLTSAPGSCSLRFTDEEIEKFAKLEHSRWNAYQLIEGFYPWLLDDDFKKNVEQQENINEYGINVKDEGRRLHACITDWDKLIELDKYLNSCYNRIPGNNRESPYAAYDREFIRAIPEIVSGFNGEFKYQCGIEELNSEK